MAADLAAWDPHAASLLRAFEAHPDLASLRALAAHVLAEDGGLTMRSFDGPVEAVDP